MAKTFRACSSPAPTLIKPHPAHTNTKPRVSPHHVVNHSSQRSDHPPVLGRSWSSISPLMSALTTHHIMIWELKGKRKRRTKSKSSDDKDKNKPKSNQLDTRKLHKYRPLKKRRMGSTPSVQERNSKHTHKVLPLHKCILPLHMCTTKANLIPQRQRQRLDTIKLQSSNGTAKHTQSLKAEATAQHNWVAKFEKLPLNQAFISWSTNSPPCWQCKNQGRKCRKCNYELLK